MRQMRVWVVCALLPLAACNGCEEDVQRAPGTLEGRICHQVTGRPSIGATIAVQVDNGGIVDEYPAESGPEGAFTVLGVPPGEHVVAARGEGVDITFPISIKSDEITEWLDPRCIDPTTQVGRGCLTGQICNRHTGMYVSQAEVSVVLGSVGYTGSTEDLETSTDTQGAFQLCDVPEGTHTVLVRASGFQKAYPATVTEGQSTEVVAAGSCMPYDPNTHCRVRGRVCTGETPPSWVEGARVTAQLLDNNGTPVMPIISETEPEFTDGDGRYEIFLSPQGRWRVQVTKGNFISRHDVDCLVGEVTEVPEGDQCLSASECRFLVATGVFDKVEDVLGRVGVPTDRIDLVDGNPADLSEDWAFQAFGDPSALAGYCGVFINCGVDESAFAGPRRNPLVLQNLRSFVNSGGTLYASDQSYDVVEALFPEKVDWYRNDELPSDAEYGINGLINASVVDPGLLSFLQQDNPGQSTVAINFAYQTWSVVQAVDPDVQVFLRANVPACADGEACTGQLTLPDTPLTIRFPVGNAGGQVVFTSFHVETRTGMNGEVLSTEDTDRVMRFLMTL